MHFVLINFWLGGCARAFYGQRCSNRTELICRRLNHCFRWSCRTSRRGNCSRRMSRRPDRAESPTVIAVEAGERRFYRDLLLTLVEGMGLRRAFPRNRRWDWCVGADVARRRPLSHRLAARVCRSTCSRTGRCPSPAISGAHESIRAPLPATRKCLPVWSIYSSADREPLCSSPVKLLSPLCCRPKTCSDRRNRT